MLSPCFFGAPDRIRTCDLCLRRAALYPAELRVRLMRAISPVLWRRNGKLSCSSKEIISKTQAIDQSVYLFKRVVKRK